MAEPTDDPQATDLGRSLPFKSGQPQNDILTAIRDLEGRHPTDAEELRDHFLEGLMRRIADEIETAGGVPLRWIQPHTRGLRPAPQRALEAALGEPLPGAAIAGRTNADTGAVRGQPLPYQPGRETAQGVTDILADEAPPGEDFHGHLGELQNRRTHGRARGCPHAARHGGRDRHGRLCRRQEQGRPAADDGDGRMQQRADRQDTETDPRELYLALHEIQRMAPRIQAGERIMGVPSLAIGAAAGQTLTGR